MRKFASELPGALIEEKYAALVFHYRQADPQRADRITKQLIDELSSVLGPELTLLEGKKVIEVMVKGISKGQAAKIWLEREDWDFIMAAGDDVTDESMFKALPSMAHSFKVGSGATAARYSMGSQSEFIGFLKRFGEK